MGLFWASACRKHLVTRVSVAINDEHFWSFFCFPFSVYSPDPDWPKHRNFSNFLLLHPPPFKFWSSNPHMCWLLSISAVLVESTSILIMSPVGSLAPECHYCYNPVGYAGWSWMGITRVGGLAITLVGDYHFHHFRGLVLEHDNGQIATRRLSSCDKGRIARG